MEKFKFKRRSKEEMDYQGPIFKKKWLDQFKNQKIEYKNTPFSLGYDIFFMSNSYHVSDDARLPLDAIKHHVGLSFKGQGFASSYDRHKVYCIAIIDDETGDEMDLIRFIEVLTHEASHVVDYIIENCVISTVDTEVRSYILDHIVGLCLRKLKIAELEGFYKSNKLIRKGK